MTVHSSPPKKTAGVRRTLYLEWWSESAAVGHGSFSKRWIDLLKSWKDILTNRSDTQNQKHDRPYEKSPSESEVIEQILQQREQPIPSNYGF